MAENYLTILEKRRPDIEKMLAEWITPERYFTMATQIRRQPELRKCSDESLVECVVQIAQMGLELNPQRAHVYIIPYGDTAQAQPGWRGLAYLRLRAGAILSVDTDVVFNDDTFEVGRSTDGDVFRHIQNFKADRTERNAYAAYARVKLSTGDYQFEVSSKDRIMRSRRHSKQPDGLMWTKFWEEGWRKTPYRVLDKRLPEGVNKDAIERYNRAMATATHFDVEVDTEEHDPNIDHPADTEGNGAPQPGLPTGQVGTAGLQPQVRNPEVVSDDDSDDRFVNNDEIREMAKYCDEHGVPLSQLRSILKKKFEVDDISKLRFGYVGMLRAEIEAAGNG